MHYGAIHIAGFEAVAIALGALLVGLLLATRYAAQRHPRAETRRVLRLLHTYGGTVAGVLALAHATGRFSESGVIDFQPVAGHVSSLLAVLLLISGALRLSPPAAWQKRPALLSRSHTVVWLSLLLVVALHGVQEWHAFTAAPAPAPVAPGGTATGRLLVAVLLPALNSGGIIHLEAMHSARLLDASGNMVGVGDIKSGAATFALKGLPSGDYFLRLNSLELDLMPVPIARGNTTLFEFVSTTLDRAVVGDPGDPDEIIRCWSPQHGNEPVVAYSSGVPIRPTRHAYAMAYLSADPPQFSTRVLGSAEALLTLRVSRDVHDPSTWLIGPANHGRQDLASCASCHGDLQHKSPSYQQVSEQQGWCYKCHYGPSGPAAGTVDPSQ